MTSISLGSSSPSTSAILLRGIEDGRATLLSIRAQPGAKRRASPAAKHTQCIRAKHGACIGEWNGRLKLAVAERAIDGRANEAIVALVAELFGVPRSRVALVAGECSRDKTVRIEASLDHVRARLAELVA